MEAGRWTLEGAHVQHSQQEEANEPLQISQYRLQMKIVDQKQQIDYLQNLNDYQV